MICEINSPGFIMTSDKIIMICLIVYTEPVVSKDTALDNICRLSTNV